MINFWDKWKINYFRCPNTLAHYSNTSILDLCKHQFDLEVFNLNSESLVLLFKSRLLGFANTDTCENITVCNPTALRTAKTLWSFGRCECNRVNIPAVKLC